MKITDGLHYLRIYWVAGGGVKGSSYNHYVKQPPCSGEQGAFILMADGAKNATIFCPVSFTSHYIPATCAEIVKAREPQNFSVDGAIKRLKRNWKGHQTRGDQGDYNTAARVLVLLGSDIPSQVLKGGKKDNIKKGGRPVADSFLSPINPKSKRGKLLQWFLDNDSKASIRAAMIEFDATRSAVLSNLRALNVDHGVGYELIGDDAKIILPPATGKFAIAGEKLSEGDEDDDSWLDGDVDEDDDEWLL